MYHELQMRRGFSIVLLLLFGLMPLSPLVDGSEDSNLPICCRRHGAHHCSMNVAALQARFGSRSGASFGIPSTCPEYPGLAAALSSAVMGLAAGGQSATIALESRGHIAQRSELAATNHAETQSGRGPPETNLL